MWSPRPWPGETLGVGLAVEDLEDALLALLADAGALVVHGDLGVVDTAVDRDRDGGVRGAELDRVAEQVAQRALQLQAVGVDPAAACVGLLDEEQQRDALGVGEQAGALDERAHQVEDLQALQRELERVVEGEAAVELGEQPAQALGAAVELLEAAAHEGVEPRVLEQRLAEAEHHLRGRGEVVQRHRAVAALRRQLAVDAAHLAQQELVSRLAEGQLRRHGCAPRSRPGTAPAPRGRRAPSRRRRPSRPVAG